MAKILLVDDDAVILEVYRKKLAQEGFEVHVAQDGLAAIKQLRTVMPDVLILDLMMPKFNGLEVLKYLKSDASLSEIKVIVLSNLYVAGAERDMVENAADGLLMKSDCTPALLTEAVHNALAPEVSPTDAADDLKGPVSRNTQLRDDPVLARTREDFLRSAPEALATLRQLNDAFVEATDEDTRKVHLLSFYRRAHLFTGMAAAAGLEQIALLSSAFEALLFELYEKPRYIGASTLQTIAYTLDFFRLLCANAGQRRETVRPTPRALVVDDDNVSTHALMGALRNAHLTAAGVEDPNAALKTLHQENYDLILLDIEMPRMNGFELCEKVRALPAYRTTPVIFVTSHHEFEYRMHSVLSGGNDLISKPVFPIELAVKALTHLLRSQLPEALGRT